MPSRSSSSRLSLLLGVLSEIPSGGVCSLSTPSGSKRSLFFFFLSVDTRRIADVDRDRESRGARQIPA